MAPKQPAPVATKSRAAAVRVTAMAATGASAVSAARVKVAKAVKTAMRAAMSRKALLPRWRWPTPWRPSRR